MEIKLTYYLKELVLYASEKRRNALIAETSKSHLLALPHGHELTQNVMLFPLCFGLLFRTPRLKKLAQSTDHQPKTAEQPDWVGADRGNGDPYSRVLLWDDCKTDPSVKAYRP